MYRLWVRRMRQLRREMNKCLRGEKENKGNELYKDMLHFKGIFLHHYLIFTSVVKFYHNFIQDNSSSQRHLFSAAKKLLNQGD